MQVTISENKNQPTATVQIGDLCPVCHAHRLEKDTEPFANGYWIACPGMFCFFEQKAVTA